VDRAKFPFYYSFQKRIFYPWDASSAKIAPEQLAWAQKSLASALPSAKMRIAIGHLPFMQWQLGAMNQARFLTMPTTDRF